MSDAAHRGTDSGGAEASQAHGGAEHLVKMANDIGNFFRAEPMREDAIAGISNHIAKFWTKRMREKLNAHLRQEGDASLDELPRVALQRLTAAQGLATGTGNPESGAPQSGPPQSGASQGAAPQSNAL
jgi:formate dehydrogenase subunit delta